MTPDQAHAAAQLIGQQLQNEWMITYKVLTAIPEDQKDYRPDANARTAFELARHLASADIWFINGVVRGTFEDPDATEPQVSSFKEIGEWYKHAFPRALEQVLAADGLSLAKELNFFGTRWPGVQYLLFALIHMVHHRGQLSAYLRPCGGKVPAIYGGSYDEPWTGPQEVNA
jgi:uncharacterized damage-inducible protein DinB